MEALVTGGGGFLGLYIVEQLVARGHSVRVFCRGEYPPLRALGVRILQGDVRHERAIREACQGVDSVFHVAAVPGVWGRWDTYYQINTIGTKNVIAACLAAGVARLIYTSSPSVVFDGRDHLDADESLPYPTNWLCHYPHSKALAEQAVLNADAGRNSGAGPNNSASAGLRTVSLRPHLIWGPRDNHLIPRLIRRAQSGNLRRVGDGRNLVSICYVENAAAAHIQVEESLRTSTAAAGRAYFINDPDPVNLWEWVNQVLQRAGLPPVTKSVSAATAKRIGHLMEIIWGLFRLPGEPPMTRFVAAQLAGSHCYSIEAAKRDFGFHTVCTPTEAMERLQPDLEKLTHDRNRRSL